MGGPDGSPPSTNASSNSVNADDESFRKLVGVGDNLTLEERVTRALDSGDDAAALQALGQATEYFVSLGDARNVVDFATRFRRHAELCYDRLDPTTGAQWSRTTKNTDVSTGPLARPFVRSLTSLSPSLMGQ